jgi:chemotaxis protein methyltransferase CheR
MLSIFKRKKSKIKVAPKIKENFTNIELVAEYFQKETGVTFEKQMSILNNKVILFCKQNKIISYDKLLVLLKQDKELKQEFINLLTTNETYFYREFRQIEELVKIIKKENKKVTILCAPSATGEEAYTIAIALLEAGIKTDVFSIMGIDINKEALKKAQNAIYGERNVKYVPTKALNIYFTHTNDKYILKENIKKQVSFRLINIFDKEFLELGKFDFVFSRNMLIYFNKETKFKAKERLESMRRDDRYNVFFGHADLF